VAFCANSDRFGAGIGWMLVSSALDGLAQIGLELIGLELADWGEAAAPSRGPSALSRSALSRISVRFAVAMRGRCPSGCCVETHMSEWLTHKEAV
jgi:hypothetical protein